jgi:uncharacterized protein
MSTQLAKTHSDALSHRARQPNSSAWWRHRWPWIILGMLGGTIVACMVTIYIAVTTQDSLVAADYTRHGKGINERLEKDLEAERRGIRLPASALRQSDGSVVFQVSFYSENGEAAPEFVRLQLAHPTIGAQDRSLALVQVQPGQYRAQTHDLMAGYWHLSLEDPSGQWRVRSRLPIDP